MKVLNLVLMMVVMGTTALFAGNTTEKFKVYGNCEMCESRIEKAALSVAGVTKADWNKETKMMEVAFDASKTSVKEIHQAIAKVGHDTELVKATNDAYNNLHGCCKYERGATNSKAKDCHKEKQTNCSGSKKSSCCKGK